MTKVMLLVLERAKTVVLGYPKKVIYDFWKGNMAPKVFFKLTKKLITSPGMI